MLTDNSNMILAVYLKSYVRNQTGNAWMYNLFFPLVVCTRAAHGCFCPDLLAREILNQIKDFGCCLYLQKSVDIIMGKLLY